MQVGLLQVAQLWQRDRATVVCCAYAQKVHCAVVICQAGPAENVTCLRCKVGVLRRTWVTFGEYFTGKGASPTNQCWCQKTRVIALLCGIKISAVHYLVVKSHASDRQTKRRTDGQTDLRQQYRALHYMQSHGKNEMLSRHWIRTTKNQFLGFEPYRKCCRFRYHDTRV